jgi:TPR repeat protein
MMNKNFNIFETLRQQGTHADVPKSQKYDLIDRAAAGSIEAAADLAEGYWKGTHDCEKNPRKAQKWAGYAAKHGNKKAQDILIAMNAQ